MQSNYEQYARNMRTALSLPEMVQTDGSIKHEYFLAKKGGFWGDKEVAKLKKGLKEFGFGEWEKIKAKYNLDYVRSVY